MAGSMAGHMTGRMTAKDENELYGRQSEIAAAALARLTNPHKVKKRRTVLAIVDARLAGRAVDSVFALPYTCARNTWHSKWKFDSVVADVLAEVEQAVQAAADADALAVVQAAQRELQMNSLGAVGALVSHLDSENGSVAVRAAKEILDRSGVGGSGSGTDSAEEDSPIAVVNVDMERI